MKSLSAKPHYGRIVVKIDLPPVSTRKFRQETNLIKKCPNSNTAAESFSMNFLKKPVMVH